MYNRENWCECPVVFCEVERRKHEERDIVVLKSDECFFDDRRRHRGCLDDFRTFVAVFDFCECKHECDPVYLENGKHGDLIPLRSEQGGFNIRFNQLKHLCGCGRWVTLVNCYDERNNHVNILSPVLPKFNQFCCNN